MNPNVYIADTFLQSLTALPQSQQKKVREFIGKFRHDPTAASLNYEPIHNVRDDRIRTVRIDLAYRAVVLHPEAGKDYVLVWVDHHDEAMDWARTKIFSVHPATGAVQALDVQIAEAVNLPALDQAVKPQANVDVLFGWLDDNALARIGVPAVLLPAIRALHNSEDLEHAHPYLPQEVYERLFWIANEGCSVEQALEYTSAAVADTIDTTDLATALAHPDSRRRFHLVESAEDLDSILDAPLEKWRIFLHPSQERLVSRNFQGPARVLGGAGTGKTVVAMHRARHLARDVFTAPQDRILFTTFTRNLAINIEQNLRNLCGSEFARIEVRNLHAWVLHFLNARGRYPAIVDEDERKQCWRNAQERSGVHGWSLAFLHREWEAVVQAQGISDRDTYLHAPRQGQLRALSRPQRGQLWQVFAAYRAELDRLGKVEWQDLVRDARQLLESGSVLLPYRAIVVDETQDFTAEDLRLLRSMVPDGPNDLFFVGDAHQRIYGYPVVMQQCRIAIRGRSAKLRINYRTTEEIRRWATSILVGSEFDDLDGAADDLAHYHSLLRGIKPNVRVFSTREDECDYLVQELQALCETARPETICLVARTHEQLRSHYLPALQRSGLPYLFLDRDTPEYAGTGVRLATMHRVKGLEFAHVLIAGMNDHWMPPRGLDAGDADAFQSERCLLHVAATRARESLTVTGWGKPSSLLAEAYAGPAR